MTVHKQSVSKAESKLHNQMLADTKSGQTFHCPRMNKNNNKNLGKTSKIRQHSERMQNVHTFKNYLLQELKEYFRKPVDVLNRTQEDLYESGTEIYKRRKSRDKKVNQDKVGNKKTKNPIIDF